MKGSMIDETSPPKGSDERNQRWENVWKPNYERLMAEHETIESQKRKTLEAIEKALESIKEMDVRLAEINKEERKIDVERYPEILEKSPDYLD